MRERNSAQKETIPSAEDIAREAYAIYEARGWQDGSDLDDWLEAERRLSAFLRSDSPMASDGDVRRTNAKNGQPMAKRRGTPPVPEEKPKRSHSSARN